MRTAKREIVPSLPDSARPHCAEKKALLLDSIAKLGTVNAATRERSEMLLAGTTLDLLRVADDRITVARREYTTARTLYSDHILGHGC